MIGLEAVDPAVARVQSGFPDLRTPLQLALQATHARRGSLLVRVDEHLIVQAARKIPRFIVARTEIPLGLGIAGWVAQNKQPLLVTGDQDLPDGLEMRSQGYRSKSFVSAPILLGRRVAGVINVADRLDGRPFERADLDTILLVARQASDVTRFHQQASEAMRRSLDDLLTELPNRRSLDRRIAEEVDRSRRYRVPLGMILLDVQSLRYINHQHGFQTGDQVLRSVADVLRTELRIHDVPFRYGDDEFIILLPHTDAAQLIVPAMRIYHRLAAAALPRRSTPQLNSIVVTLGLAGIPDHGDGADDMLRHAREALDHAKLVGRHIEIWRPTYAAEIATSSADASCEGVAE